MAVGRHQRSTPCSGSVLAYAAGTVVRCSQRNQTDGDEPQMGFGDGRLARDGPTWAPESPIVRPLWRTPFHPHVPENAAPPRAHPTTPAYPVYTYPPRYPTPWGRLLLEVGAQGAGYLGR